MPEPGDFEQIKEHLQASESARSVTISQLLSSFRDGLDKFRIRKRKSVKALDKMLSDFRAKSQENTRQITTLAQRTASFILDSCKKDQDRAGEVYRLFGEMTQMLREYAQESEARANEVADFFSAFSDEDIDRRDAIVELCRRASDYLEMLSRKRHERQEDVQVILGQLRLENRERLDWMSSAFARLRADERDRSHAFEERDTGIARDVRQTIERFRADSEESSRQWNELRASIRRVIEVGRKQ